ncbi:substrate-binding domain-containing protein [bacterium]|nr:substrate-binding domain-containing protein [bacterium]MBU1615707.1 substrate-binding domain-containing protein [bacterium]
MMRDRLNRLLAVGVLVAFVGLGCFKAEEKVVRLRMSSTTSTDNTGLFEALNPPFEKKYGVKVDVIAVGTGKALRLAQNGDVDITFVHAREREIKFVEEGFGVNRREVMANYFMIAGPVSDPVKVKEAKTAVEAFQRIAKAKAFFISRGDDSGTHTKEKSIWQEAGIAPKGDWYLETGQGMGATLTIADEKQAYTLIDRGTYLKYLDKIEIRGVFEKQSPALYNPYGIIAVNPARHPHSKYTLALGYIAWVTSPEGQKIIANFKDKTGKALFTPLAVNKT